MSLSVLPGNCAAMIDHLLVYHEKLTKLKTFNSTFMTIYVLIENNHGKKKKKKSFLSHREKNFLYVILYIFSHLIATNC